VGKTKQQAYPQSILDLMAWKTAILSKAQAIAELGMPQTATPLWAAAAGCEEQLAPLLEALGRDREAAVHRISAASCYHKAGEPRRAANLYRAALAGPLAEHTRREVEQMLSRCLAELNSLRRPGTVPSKA
jgi:hypothetical protein